MTFLEQLRNAGISDEEIITCFQFKADGYSKSSKRSYSFGSIKDPANYWGELHFNAHGVLYKIDIDTMLATEKAQTEFINEALNDINGEHGYMIRHRILFSQRLLNGKFQWKNDFRIRPCLNTSNIGKGLAWGIEDPLGREVVKHLGPPYPFILEVRTRKSPNYILETNRAFEALDFFQWTIGLLIPHLLGAPVAKNGQPRWTMLQKDNVPEYHLAYEAFNAHESEIETGEDFSPLNIPDTPRYLGAEDYYNHLWFQSNEIELPNQMEYYLDLIDNLPKETKENFRRSLYWFNTGSRLYNQEQLSVIPFTIAVECLLPNPSNELCPSCKKPLGDGPTKLFKKFMEKHLSLPENIEHLKKSIYPKRSTMVHGSYTAAADEGFYSINKFDESEFLTESFVRRAIINWLATGDFEK